QLLHGSVSGDLNLLTLGETIGAVHHNHITGAKPRADFDALLANAAAGLDHALASGAVLDDEDAVHACIAQHRAGRNGNTASVRIHSDRTLRKGARAQLAILIGDLSLHQQRTVLRFNRWTEPHHNASALERDAFHPQIHALPGAHLGG